MKVLQGGRLTIGVVSTAKYFAPKLLAMFNERYPNLELRLQVNNREAVVQMLAGNEIDVAVMGTAPRRLDTVAAPFAGTRSW
jgi:DNA-binding transcriptional LysR family regulator